MGTHQTSPASHQGVSLEAVHVGVPRIDPGEDVLKHDCEENMYICIHTSPNVLGMLVVFFFVFRVSCLCQSYGNEVGVRGGFWGGGGGGR